MASTDSNKTYATLCDEWKDLPLRSDLKFSVYMYIGMYLPACVMGIAFNIFNILVLGKLKGAMYFLVKCLAINDLAFSIAAFVIFPLRTIYIFAVLGDILFRRDDWFFGAWFIYLGTPFFYIFQTTRNWCTTILSFERLIVIMFPMSSRNLPKKVISTIAMLVVGAFAFAFHFVHFLPYQRMPSIGCPARWPYVTHFSGTYDLIPPKIYIFWRWHISDEYMFLWFTVTAPLAILVVMNVALVAAVLFRKFSRRSELGVKDDSSKNELRVLRMVMSVIGVYIVCEGLGFLDRMNSWNWFKITNKKSQMILRKVSLGFSIIDSSVNFGIYCLTNEHFRKQAIDMVERLPGCGNSLSRSATSRR
ncbi:G-protein coupled receptor daf-37-like [Tubulanus polymorphus]|uniref:G-protein coupled receptor daf-37-like n=1 Tax=Tubulanus polymorphus TaxID=672921 RepID=UPI003DA2D0A6